MFSSFGSLAILRLIINKLELAMMAMSMPNSSILTFFVVVFFDIWSNTGSYLYHCFKFCLLDYHRSGISGAIKINGVHHLNKSKIKSKIFSASI